MKATLIALLLTIGLAAFPTVTRADELSGPNRCMVLAYQDADRDSTFWHLGVLADRIGMAQNNELHVAPGPGFKWDEKQLSPKVFLLTASFLTPDHPRTKGAPTFYFMCNPKARRIEPVSNDATQADLRHMYAELANAKAAEEPPAPREHLTLRPSCPNVEATTTNAVAPDTPPDAQQQGISGVVNVVIQLDANSHLVGTPTVQSSPNKLLNEPAILAAEQSTFRTAIRNCKPVAATFVFAVEFNNN